MMDIKRSELLLAKAADAIARDQHPEAVELYEQLWEVYQRYAWLDDAQIALCFNQLCAALSLDEDEPSFAPAQRLLNLFLECPEPKPLIQEVATRLYQLLSNPQPKRAKLSQNLQEQLLHAVAPYAYELGGHHEPHLSLEEPLSAEHLTLIQPSDAGLLAYLMAAHSPSPDDLQPWLQALHQAHIMSSQLTPEVQELLTLIREELFRQTPDLVYAYQLLLECFCWAVDESPLLAFEWLVGLIAWESDQALLELIDLELNRPRERRLTQTITLHERHAARLINEQGGERLAMHHLQEVIRLGEYMLGLYREREIRRGQRNISDVESAALVSISLCDAYLVHGDASHAHTLLEEALRDASTSAFTRLVIAPSVYLAEGRACEQLGYLDDAMNAYESAARSTNLEVFLCHPYTFEVDALVDALHHHLTTEVLEVGALSIIHYYRLWAQLNVSQDPSMDLSVWRQRIQWPQALLSVARAQLPYQLFLELSLTLELTLCALRDPLAPQRALSLARALKDKSGVTLAKLYELLDRQRALEAQQRHQRDALSLEEQRFGVERGYDEQLSRLISEWRAVFEEACLGANNSINKRLGLGLVNLSLKLIELRERGALRGAEALRHYERLDEDLKKLLSYVGRGALTPLSGRFDRLLPPCALAELREGLSLLMREERAASARLYCWALRHINHSRLYTPHRRDFAEEIAETHKARFERVWVEGGVTLKEHCEAYQALVNKPNTSERPVELLQPRSGRLELRVFEDTTFAFLTLEGRQRPLALNLNIPRSQLEGLVRRLTETLDSQAPLSELNALGEELYQHLLAPLEDELLSLHRLYIACDAPLQEVPFCLLRTSEGRYLVELLELINLEVASDPNIPSEPRVSQALGVVGEPSKTQPIIDAIKPLLSTGRFESAHTLEPAVFNEAHRAEQPSLQLLCLRGEYRAELFEVSHDPDQAPLLFTMRDLSQSIAAYQPAALMIADPIPRGASQPLLNAALSATHSVVIAIHRETPHVQRWAQQLLRAATTPYRLFSYSASLTDLRRAAIAQQVSPREWSAFELYVADRSPAEDSAQPHV